MHCTVYTALWADVEGFLELARKDSRVDLAVSYTDDADYVRTEGVFHMVCMTEVYV